MPFDMTPVETKPDVFSLESLVAWLEKQPADGEYDYVKISDCLLCQYFRYSGIPVSTVNPYAYRLADRIERPYPRLLDSVADPVERTTSTYGEALQRARSLLGVP